MPFQSSFTSFLCEDLGYEYSFEETSILMMHKILDEQEEKLFNDDEVSLIEAIVKGEHWKLDKSKKYLGNIINNKENYIDIKKLNSIERDRKYYGILEGIDLIPIYDAKIINGRLTYNEKV